MNRNLGLSTGIVALLALVIHVAAPTGSEKSSNQQELSSAEKAAVAAAKNAARPDQEPPKNPIEGPWFATQKFFGSSVDVPFETTRKMMNCGQDRTCPNGYPDYFGIEPGYSFEFLLATVPDPYHTRLSLITDSSIQAIQKAATDAGWEFATEWLPWMDTIDPDEKDPEKLREQRARIVDQEKQPGLLVFRQGVADMNGSAFSKHVLLVFVVGETPTAGVNPAQFELARDYMQALGELTEVSIQGPTFSGSFFSLGRLINADKSKTAGKMYIVRSGTAASFSEADAFANLPQVDFHGASENASDQGQYFQDALAGLHVSLDQAAVLIEDETAYGESVNRAFTAPAQTTAGARFEKPLKKTRTFRYPRDIAHLRNAYREAVQASTSARAPVSDLDFSIKDTGVGEDSIPIFSPAQTPLAQNAVLNQIVGAIRRERIRLVEVTGTNVLDVLFLARVLKRQCPDTRLVLPYADLLFVEAAQTDALAGTLALSSYPIFFASTPWMGRNVGPATFRDANSEGVYNATILLLTRRWPPNTKPLHDYHWRSQPYPPVWLLTLDRGGFSPVRVWVDSADEIKNEKWFDSEPAGADTNLSLPRPPRMWMFVATSLELLSLALAIWILSLFLRPKALRDARLSIIPGQDEDGWRLFYVFLFFLTLAGMQVLILMPLGQAGLVFPAVVPAAIAVWALIAARGLKRPRLAMLLVLAIVCGGLILWAVCCFAPNNNSQGFFFRFRALELRLGSSPMWPILAAAGALLVFSFVHLTRLYFAAHQEPDIALEIRLALRDRLKQSRSGFHDSLHSAAGFCNRKQAAWLSGVVVALGVVAAFSRVDIHLSSIDGGYFDLLSIALQLVLIAALLLTCWHITGLWHSLKSFVASLDTLPLANSFVPTDSSKSRRPIWVRHLNLQSLDIPIRSALVLHDMSILPPEPGVYGPSEEEFWFHSYSSWLRTLLSTEPQHGENALDARKKLGTLSVRIANETIGGVILKQWMSEPLAGTMQSEKTPKPEAPAGQTADKSPTMADLAQTFVALHFSSFLLYGVRQIRNLIWFLPLGFVLLMISMTSDSPQSPQLIGRFLLVLFVGIGYVVWRCLSEIERSPILSRISGTNPGELNADFYFKLIAMGGLPVIGILAATFPSISNFLFSFVQPALEALH